MSHVISLHPLVLNYHPFNFKVRDVINKNFHILKNDPETSSIFSDNPLVSFRHSKNIRETLVHSSLAQASTSQKGTFPCLSSKGKTCDFVDSTTIVSAPKSDFHIKHHFTCASSHHREPKRWSVLVLYIFQFIYFSVFILPFNWIITLNYTNMSYNNNTPIVEHIITTYKLICICMFFSLFI